MKYNKDDLKKNLNLNQIYDLLNDLGAEPIIKDNCIISKTICHNSNLNEASHKLYYYDNSHLFHCYTGCGNASFDIFDLIVRVNKTAGNENFPLPKAIAFIARYFGYSYQEFDFDEEPEKLLDWNIINTFKQNKEKYQPKIVQLKHYDESVLKNLPTPHIVPWEAEGIIYPIIKDYGIRYNPINEAVIIPHYDIDNNLIGIRERTLIKENEKYGKYRPALLNGKMYNHPLGFNLYNLNNSKTTISYFQKAIVFEGEKSCLKYASFFGKDADISVACCGSNLIDYQIKLLLSLNVKEIIIAFDKQFQKIGDDEWKIWTRKLNNFYVKYGGYVKLSYMFDITGTLLNYKDSPIDKDKETFLELFKNRIAIE